MKCLSLWQPWASLLVHGKKQVETRGWEMRHRGPLLIHAAKKWDASLLAISRTEPFRSAIGELLKAEGFDWRWPDNMDLRTGLRFGAIVGRANVVACYPTGRVRTVEAGPTGRTEGGLLIGPTEHAFGDYSPGRFAFLCAGFTPFATPVPYRGNQGLFEVPDAVLAKAGVL